MLNVTFSTLIITCTYDVICNLFLSFVSFEQPVVIWFVWALSCGDIRFLTCEKHKILNYFITTLMSSYCGYLFMQCEKQQNSMKLVQHRERLKMHLRRLSAPNSRSYLMGSYVRYAPQPQ